MILQRVAQGIRAGARATVDRDRLVAGEDIVPPVGAGAGKDGLQKRAVVGGGLGPRRPGVDLLPFLVRRPIAER